VRRRKLPLPRERRGFLRRAPRLQRGAPRARRSRRGLWRRLAWLAVALVAADLAYLAWIWPDFAALASGPPPRSAFMRAYDTERAEHRGWPQIRWQPVPLASISPSLLRALVVAEDSRFFSHDGIDLDALQEAWSDNLERGRLRVGGSTISQQTAKNLFLSASRNPLRKWHEIVLTLVMEQRLTKRRILELYANVAEFGLGVYGAEAAARHYFGTGAAALSERQAAELAAALPSPRRNNPALRTRFFEHRVRRIARHLEAARVALPAR
jgi:monofunctional biosynthetic peptidoglycan transglycosylase